jgi:hypothetical protein
MSKSSSSTRRVAVSDLTTCRDRSSSDCTLNAMRWPRSCTAPPDWICVSRWPQCGHAKDMRITSWKKGILVRSSDVVPVPSQCMQRESISVTPSCDVRSPVSASSASRASACDCTRLPIVGYSSPGACKSCGGGAEDHFASRASSSAPVRSSSARRDSSSTTWTFSEENTVDAEEAGEAAGTMMRWLCGWSARRLFLCSRTDRRLRPPARPALPTLRRGASGSCLRTGPWCTSARPRQRRPRESWRARWWTDPCPATTRARTSFGTA